LIVRSAARGIRSEGAHVSPRRRRLVSALLASLAAAGGLAACSSAHGAGSGGSGLTVGLGYIGTVENYGPYYAEREGLYKAQGLSVDVQPGGNTPPSTLLAAGRINIGVMDAPDMLTANAAGAHLVAIAAEFQLTPTSMTCRVDSHVTKTADLRGKTLGLKAQEQTYLPMILQSGGLTAHDLHVVPVGNSDISPIVAGKVDCIFATYAINDGRSIEAQGVKINNLSLADMGMPAQGDVYVTTQDFYSTHQAELTKWVLATAQAWQTFLKDPNAAAQYMVSKAFAPGLDTGQEIYQAQQQVPYLSTDWTKAHGLLALNPSSWSQTAAAMSKLGMTNTTVDTSGLLKDLTGAAGTPKA
jgi:NitT/TauT family transport system substrate-binding protein